MNRLGERIKLFMRKHGVLLCNLAVLAAISMSNECKFLFYESEEPDGLDDFLSEGCKQIKGKYLSD